MMLLLWMGSAAFGVTWGWLVGLWTTPNGAPAASPGLGNDGQLFSRRIPPTLRSWLNRAYQLLQRLAESDRGVTVARWVRRGFLLLLVLAPMLEVWLFGGTGPVVLFVVAAATGLWLHHAWREYLANKITD